MTDPTSMEVYNIINGIIDIETPEILPRSINGNLISYAACYSINNYFKQNFVSASNISTLNNKTKKLSKTTKLSDCIENIRMLDTEMKKKYMVFIHALLLDDNFDILDKIYNNHNIENTP
jgi:hypothetical protein